MRESTQPQRVLNALLILGAPLVTGLLVATHPTLIGKSGPVAWHGPVVDWWIALHVIQLPLFVAVGLAAYRLIGAADDIIAAGGKLALLAFLTFYPAYDAVVGIGTGTLVRIAGDLPPQQQAVAAQIIDGFWRSRVANALGGIGSLAWAAGLVACGLVFIRPGRSRGLALVLGAGIVVLAGGSGPLWPVGDLRWWVVGGTLIVLLGLVAQPRPAVALLAASGLFFAASHTPPYGPLAMAAFFLAGAQILWLQRVQAPVLPSSGPHTKPDSASTPADGAYRV